MGNGCQACAARPPATKDIKDSQDCKDEALPRNYIRNARGNWVQFFVITLLA